MVPSGRAMLGAHWHIAGQKSAKLFVANPQELQMVQWFCGRLARCSVQLSAGRGEGFATDWFDGGSVAGAGGSR
jgi:hypothetical protein